MGVACGSPSSKGYSHWDDTPDKVWIREGWCWSRSRRTQWSRPTAQAELQLPGCRDSARAPCLLSSSPLRDALVTGLLPGLRTAALARAGSSGSSLGEAAPGTWGGGCTRALAAQLHWVLCTAPSDLRPRLSLQCFPSTVQTPRLMSSFVFLRQEEPCVQIIKGKNQSD